MSNPPPRLPPDGQSFCWREPICSEETVQHHSNTQHQRSIHQPPPPPLHPSTLSTSPHPTTPSGTPSCLKDDTVYPGWVPREKQIVVLFFCSNRTEQQVACLPLTRIIKPKDAGWCLWLMSHESSASSAHQTAA